MNDERNHTDIEELLGAYALDAVDEDEKAAVEAHLPTCPRCAAEVADHREVAAQLANTGADAPEGVWARIVESLEETPPTLDIFPPRAARPEPPGAAVVSLADRRPVRRWLPMSAAAAALVVVGLVAGFLVADDPTPTQPEFAQPDLADVARRMLNDPGSVEVELVSSGSDVEARAVVGPDGSGYLLGTSLPALDDSQTYQLWGVRDDAVISLGILGRAPDVVAFHLDDSIDALAITAEVAGGVEKSANEAVVAGEVA